MKYKKPRGTSDLFGERMRLWRHVEEILAACLHRYGYEEFRTPIFEMTDLFVRAVGEATDIVTKEMYTFADKKGRSLTLRPENTAPVMRAFLENSLHRRGGIARYYYIGPMFRYDRPQAGRYRQFHQVGAEAIGSSNPAVDAEIIDMSLGIYRNLGYPLLDVRLNSVGCPICRPAFKEVLREALEDFSGELCGNCKERGEINPLRVFDCKECDEVKAKLPRITDHLCGECAGHFERLQGILRDLGVNYTIDPLLVRGLDYYTKTAYEIVHPELGAQNALCGGGRYDGLAEECGGGSIPAVGFSAGMERLFETLPEAFRSGIPTNVMDAYVVVMEEAGDAVALNLANRLRAHGLTVSVDLSGRGLKRQLRAASEANARFAVLLGSNEIARGEATVKNLATGEQAAVKLDALPEAVAAEGGDRT